MPWPEPPIEPRDAPRRLELSPDPATRDRRAAALVASGWSQEEADRLPGARIAGE